MRRRGNETRRRIQMNKAIEQTSSVMLPLLELFAVLDDIYTEEDALSKEHVRHSAGRAYRAWKEAREALDPDFDPDNYRKRPRRAGTNPSSPLAIGSQNSSSGPKSISAKNRKKTGKKGKPGARKSARPARSSGRA